MSFVFSKRDPVSVVFDVVVVRLMVLIVRNVPPSLVASILIIVYLSNVLGKP